MLPATSYTKHAIAGFSWQTILKVATGGITLVKIFFLARLLTPTDFGLFAVTLIALGISEAFTQTGVNITLLQSKRPVSYFLDTAWVISIGRGFLISIVMIVLGLGLSRYFQNPQLTILIALTSLVPAIKGFINPSVINMRKEFRFFRESIYFVSLAVIDALAAILFSFTLRSVEGMIAGLIAAAIFEVLISMLFFSPRPHFRYLTSRAESILSNAKWLSLSSLMGYLNDNLDDFLIGSVVGTYRLGLYHNAYALSHKANYDVARSIHHGTFPIFAKLNTDGPRLKRAFFKSFKSSILLLAIVSLPLFIFPRLVVQIVLGEQWLEITPLIKWLAAAGLIHSLALLSYALFIAKSAYRVLNIHQFVNLILMAGLIILLAKPYGLTGAVIGLFLARLVSLPIVFYGIRIVTQDLSS